MAGGRYPRRAVDGEAHVATVLKRGLARADAHADADVPIIRPLVRGEGSLRLDGGVDGGLCAREDVEERVALRVDLMSAMGRECRTHDRAVLAQDLAVALPKPALELRRALDVGEKERDSAAWQLAHG
jgi:hypothetical protein